jgi:peptide/nickel transport system substrate-binding protein/oligopeptide transport system substrate-binding protein
VLALCVAVSALITPIPAPAQSSRAAPEGGVYRRPLAQEPATLDPARISDVYSRSVAQQIFDGLVQFDSTLTVTPALAQFWKASRDGKTWTFTLRRGVKFHHGRELTADDVVFSFTRILDPRLKSSAAAMFSNIEGAAEFQRGAAAAVSGLSALDASTVQIVLTESFAPFVSVLAMGHAKILPRDLVERGADAFGTAPVGTGPFKFSGWERGRSIALVRNADYFDGPPHLRGLVFRVFQGGNVPAMYEEFRQGRLEDTPVPTTEHSHAAAAVEYQYIKRPMFSLRHYGFNTRMKPLDDRRVRRAITAAIDRPAILDGVFLSRYIPAHGIVPPGTLAFNPGVKATAFDPTRARALLAEAGYAGGRGMPAITFVSGVRSERILTEHGQIKKALDAVGIRAEFQYQTDWPTFVRTLGEGKAGAYLYAWHADIPDPDNFLHLLFHSRSPRNYMGYANPLVDELLTRARGERDLQRRVDLYRRAEQIILDDAPLIPFWHYPYERLFQPYVRSVEVNGLGDPYIPLRKIRLEPAR